MSNSVLGGLAIATLALASPVVAQTGPAQDPPAEGQVSEIDEVLVTGSRIPRPNLEQPTPVSTLSNEAIENAGVNDLGEIVSQLPQMSSNGTARANSGGFNPGLSFPDLRSFGGVRTLTLVDGKRHVGGAAGANSVDLNSIPQPLVERVEVITGGASAIYGSDAVTGVVNIILKDDFEGVEFGAQVGGPSELRDDGGDSRSAYLAIGGDFRENRGNAVFSFFWDDSKQLTGPMVPALMDYGTINNPADGDPNDPFDSPIENNGIPDTLIVPAVGSEFISRNGAATPDGVRNYGFDSQGNPVRQPLRTGENSFAFGQLLGCVTCYFQNPDLVIAPDFERMGFNTRVRYELAPNVTFKVDAKYVAIEASEFVQPSFSFFTDVINLQTTPFLSPSARAFFASEGVSSAFVSRMLYDIADGRRSNVNRRTWRIVPSVEGRFDASFAEVDWEAFYNVGETTNENSTVGLLLPGNYAAAIDAVRDPVTGEIRCRTAVAVGGTPEPCVPYNPFGEQNSAEAKDYVSTNATLTEFLRQEQAGLTFAFDTSRFLNLQGGAVGIAGGIEYRKEYSEATTDPIIQAGLTEFAAQPDAPGGFDVNEAFIEFNAPILADTRLAHRLSIDAAYRIADYSHAGRAEAWKVGLLYAPVADLTLRGTFSESVRAPNITEAFLPRTPGFTAITDPCDQDNIGADPDRAANCAADGLPPNFASNTNVTISSESGGNVDLEPEQAETFTFGVIFQPRWLPGLALTVDYYDIEITDAIIQPTAQAIIDNCYDSSQGLDPTFCDQFTRGPDQNINFLSRTFLNSSRILTSGVDFQLSYRRELESLTRGGPFAWLDGNLSMSVNGNHLDEFSIYQFQSDPTDENVEVGEIGDPEWSFLTNMTYRQGPVSFNWQARYEGQTIRYEATPFNDDGSVLGSCEDVSPCRIDGIWYHDFVVRYQVPVFDDVEVYAGVNNAFNEEIPLGLGGAQDTSAAYDILGRYFFAGFKARF